uniref:Ribosomal protein L19 n=1 Tax=Platysiphonia delicata TaxID=2006979 RepID=A0A1Z1M0S5_9FLOR|nr:ribosomal protein L19 [Platysiphonia delicata]ARW59666.1 ribosomal protein L19 [Platysiphonia delicata]
MKNFNKYTSFTKTLKDIENKLITSDIPDIRTGDNILLKLEILEGTKKRIQTIRGIVISKHASNFNTTITIRKIIQNIGVERVYLINSPLIKEIQITNKSKVRKSKLYYLRQRSGKSMRLKQKI